jgi:hypothetical protein
MPACVAHYQYGQEVLCRLGAQFGSVALAYRREYEIGLQGPDIFFFYRPNRKTGIPAYGVKRHGQPPIRMFAPILEQKREKAALSCLMGLICHYVLDKCCHPYVYEHSRNSSEHLRMETAFDRYLISRYDLPKDRYRCFPVTGADYEAMASLWPGMTGDIVRRSVKAERHFTWLLDHERLLKACETAARRRGTFTQISLPASVPAPQAEHVRQLYLRYEKALEEGPDLIRKAIASMGSGPVDLPEFDLNYRGEASVRGSADGA